MKDKTIIGWYYKSIRDSLRQTMKHTDAYREYCNLVVKNFEE